MDDDQFPFDKPELADAAYKRFKATQDASVVRDLVRSLKLREAQVTTLTAQRDALLVACQAYMARWRGGCIDFSLMVDITRKVEAAIALATATDGTCDSEAEKPEEI